MKWTRRSVLLGGAALTASVSVPLQPGIAQTPATSDVMVVIFLRGGCDSLNFVAPVNDRHYLEARGVELRLQDSGEQAGLVLGNVPVGQDFRLHPAALELKELYDSGHLAIIHACGLANGTRSHFDAMDFMERGTLHDKGLNTGWITRHLAQKSSTGLLSAVAIGTNLPGSLLNCPVAVTLPDLAGYALPGDDRYQAALQQFYGGDRVLDLSAQETFKSVTNLRQKLTFDQNGSLQAYVPENNVSYPTETGEDLGKALKVAAQLIKLDLGLQVVTVDYGDWDTHIDQPYRFPQLVTGLSQALGAFYNDLSHYHQRLNIVVMSEFGRRLRANQSNGTDHGYGGLMMVLGGQVNGGRMYGKWKGLGTEQLDDGADLAITTDYRTVLSEILVQRLRSDIGEVFAGFNYQPLGILKS